MADINKIYWGSIEIICPKLLRCTTDKGRDDGKLYNYQLLCQLLKLFLSLFIEKFKYANWLLFIFCIIYPTSKWEWILCEWKYFQLILHNGDCLLRIDTRFQNVLFHLTRVITRNRIYELENSKLFLTLLPEHTANNLIL